jgi:hypothetical protein
MALAMLALLSALAGGVVRLGWSLPVASSLAVFHGPLMVAGFLGTVIGLERAVALGRWWVYGAPIASGLGAAALIGNMPAGAWLMAFASATTVVAGAEVVRRQPTTFTVVMGLGALSWLGGQIAWLAGQPIHRVVFWWAGFLVLTIVGERLELTRLVRLGRAARAAFVVAVAALLGGLVVTSVAPNTGGVVIGERAGRRNITLQMSVDERLGEIQADERKIRQVVLNLLSNAIKFTPEGERIEVAAVPKDGSAEVSVTDTGVGIAPEDQEAVFEEFQQVGTAAKKVEGTGLGLTLCRKFVELHGGRIWVKSTVGAGSTFTFTIPVRHGE